MNIRWNSYNFNRMRIQTFEQVRVDILRGDILRLNVM